MARSPRLRRDAKWLLASVLLAAVAAGIAWWTVLLWQFWLVALGFASVAIVFAWKILCMLDHARRFPEHEAHVTFDDDAIRVNAPREPDNSMRWEDLQTVTIRTTDLGPFVCDSFIHLIGNGRELIIPLGAQGYAPLTERLMTLRGYDLAAATAAARSTENATFVCWQRELVNA